jgi:hypothetical protein
VSTPHNDLKRLIEFSIEKNAESAMSHFLRHFHDPHDPAQAAKIREQATDPSNK